MHGQLIQRGAFLRHNQELRHRDRGAGAQVAPPRRAGGRRCTSSRSTMPWCRRTSGAASSSSAGGARPSAARPSCCSSRASSSCAMRPRRSPSSAFPEALEVGGVAYALCYKFEPGHPLDGVTMTRAAAPAQSARRAALRVAGARAAARQDQPSDPRSAQEPAQALRPGAAVRDGGAGDPGAGDRPLLPALSEAILRKTGVEVPLDAWDRRRSAAAPAHELSRWWTTRARSWRWAAICRRCVPSSASRRGGSSARARAKSSSAAA